MAQGLRHKYGYLWVTLGLFIFSAVGHWIFAWITYVDEQADLNRSPELTFFIRQTFRDTFENWQSEFLQLIWQVAGLAYLYYIGSPQSKEGDDRKEEKLDAILRKLDKKNGEQIISALARKYPQN